MTHWECYVDRDGVAFAIKCNDPNVEADGRRFFDTESEACERAIIKNRDNITRIQSVLHRLEQQELSAVRRETEDLVRSQLEGNAVSHKKEPSC